MSNLREAKSAHTVQILTQQLRHQHMELSSRSQDCEKSRREQYLLFTEVRSRERAHQETSTCVRDVVAELRETQRAEAELREEAYQDDISQER